MNYMKMVEGQNMTDERTLQDLLKRADAECEERSAATPSTPPPKARTKPHFNDEAQRWIQTRVNAAFERYTRKPADLDRVGKGRTKRLADISDADFIRALTEPQQLDLDEVPTTGRKLEDIDDATFAKALTDPVTTNID
ncbi:hypothetical protein [Syntrophorhabdus aromaticivorans]|uniref:hypothetical protein n=1 Tax=Syntrophorhabdus aromaticivorans TaxID=328301 RepID=UPI00048B8C09|nr:hypothetical protein [Syntrophorhabdus aromaticivorans]